MDTISTKYTFQKGFFDGMPIGFAYLAVSFTFGLTATIQGLSTLFATIISGTNITSAGQFAGLKMILENTGYITLFVAIFIINLRYMLMSISLSQQLTLQTNTLQRFFMSCFITDEIFALATLSKKELNFKYFIGLSILPYIGWTLGTFLGGMMNSALPTTLQNAMGIALYCMFIAIIIPPAKKSVPIILCISLSILIECVLEFTILKQYISIGLRVIIASIIASTIIAIIFPIKPENENNKVESNDI